MSGAYALGMVAGSDDAKSAVINAKGIEEREGIQWTGGQLAILVQTSRGKTM
jgi:hypothetical protein